METSSDRKERYIFRRKVVQHDIFNLNPTSSSSNTLPNKQGGIKGEEVMKNKLEKLERILEPVRRSWHEVNNGRILSVLSTQTTTSSSTAEQGKDSEQMFAFVGGRGLGVTKGSSVFNLKKRNILNQQGIHIRRKRKVGFEGITRKLDSVRDAVWKEGEEDGYDMVEGWRIKAEGWDVTKVGLFKEEISGKGGGKIKHGDIVGVDVGTYGGDVVEVGSLLEGEEEEEEEGRVLACKFGDGGWRKGGKFGGEGRLEKMRRRFLDEDIVDWVNEKTEGRGDVGERIWRIELIKEGEVGGGNSREDDMIAEAIVVNTRMCYNEIMREGTEAFGGRRKGRRKDLRGWDLGKANDAIGRRWRMELRARDILKGMEGVKEVRTVEVEATSGRAWIVAETKKGGAVDIWINGEGGEVKVDGIGFKEVEEAMGRVEGIIEDM
ncbi:hypothetical protein TrCOL_g428 [Triparma columacea]|uniref:Uncharacterized protein n=1 Tax=Triparma columacea TaxID=722753 RepID=A0A9W7GHU7_9STRA|nr:hypothetical protein TrCOL_g428 [Triparma columacea]